MPTPFLTASAAAMLIRLVNHRGPITDRMITQEDVSDLAVLSAMGLVSVGGGVNLVMATALGEAVAEATSVLWARDRATALDVDDDTATHALRSLLAAVVGGIPLENREGP